MAQANSALTQRVIQDPQDMLSTDPDARHLNKTLRDLAKGRYQLPDDTLMARSGAVVMGGPDRTEALGDLDRLLMLWDWRSGPTPWLWLESKARLANGPSAPKSKPKPNAASGKPRA